MFDKFIKSVELIRSENLNKKISNLRTIAKYFGFLKCYQFVSILNWTFLKAKIKLEKSSKIFPKPYNIFKDSWLEFLKVEVE